MGEGQTTVTGLVLKELWGKARKWVLLYNQIWLTTLGENPKTSVANQTSLFQCHAETHVPKSAWPQSLHALVCCTVCSNRGLDENYPLTISPVWDSTNTRSIQKKLCFESCSLIFSWTSSCRLGGCRQRQLQAAEWIRRVTRRYLYAFPCSKDCRFQDYCTETAKAKTTACLW